MNDRTLKFGVASFLIACLLLASIAGVVFWRDLPRLSARAEAQRVAAEVEQARAIAAQLKSEAQD